MRRNLSGESTITLQFRLEILVFMDIIPEFLFFLPNACCNCQYQPAIVRHHMAQRYHGLEAWPCGNGSGKSQSGTDCR